ncbi:pleckstrin homology domain-containing family G member 7 isoform X3 [Colius striatus]|uniref:pleckstrin homology domain-containing family G member 7 isoform X3 n=1 Tax=Colius striatus TaxID=57412 RepID=UPI002B1DCBEF|nr:pleckstrin homology domain-containing family G member 7 isoform X3 [Colius striatus]
MQEPSSNYSLDLVKETCISVELLKREADLHIESVVLSGSNSPEDVFSSCEMQATAVCMDTTKSSGDNIRRRGYTESSLLKFPTEEYIGSNHTPFQFDRHALARISTSPTLRRLRMASASQGSSFQDCSDSAQLGKKKEHISSLHICKSPSRCTTTSSLLLPSCVHAKLLSSKAKSETIATDPKSTSPKSKLPSQKDPLSNGSPSETIQNTWRPSSTTLPERLCHPTHAPQDGVQKCGLPIQRSAERRRSSVVVSLTGLEVFPGDLLVSDSAVDYLPHAALLLSAESKKPRWPFAKRGVGKDKQKQASDLENCLSTVKIMDFSTYEFFCFKSKSWHEFLKAQQTEQKDVDSRLEVQKEAAVWELFTSECTYFLDHLLVLKMIFVNTLKYLQSNEFLLDVDLWRLFANLEELNKISLSFLRTFFETMKEHVSKLDSPMDFSSLLRKSFLQFFQGDLCQTHQIYCLNYTSAVFYFENLRQREDFGTYLKSADEFATSLSESKLKPKAGFPCLQQWCEQNEQCKRLHLPELLVAPLHRLTRYPLLLNNIWKRSTDETEKGFIWSLKEKVEKSIRDLEGKVKWLDNFQKFRQLQEVIIWPHIWDRDKRFFVPECLKQSLRENSSENILSSTNRLLLHEGRLMLADCFVFFSYSESTRLLDVYLFLFNDFLLITKIKRNKKKYGCSDTGLIPVCPSLTPELQSFIRDGGLCTVLDQPIPLDRLILKNIDPIHITVFSLRNAFLIQHENRYRQCIAVFLLQAQTETAKKTWMLQIETAISNYTTQHETKQSTKSCFPDESSEIS